MSLAASLDQSKLNDSMNKFTAGLEAALGKSLNPLNDLAKNLSSSGTQKSVKGFGKAMKSMAGASVQAWAMEQIMKLMEPFMKLFELLEIPINVLAALLTMLVNEVFKDLLPYILDFSMMLFKLMPLFKWLGEFIGTVLVIAIELIRIGLIIFWEFLKTLPEKIKDIWEKMVIGFQNFGIKIKEKWQSIFGPEGVIATAFTNFGTRIKEGWQNIFGPEGIIMSGITKMIDGVKGIINSVLEPINAIIGDINDTLGSSLPTIPLLGDGGITTGPTLAMIGEAGTEVVIPLDRMNEFGGNAEMVSEQEDTNRLLRILVGRKKEASRWQI